VFTSTILPAIPRPARWFLRKLYFLPLDLAERISGERDVMVPPRSENFTGSAEGFRRSGEELVEKLIRLADLDERSCVLDVGSGVGRLAVALTRHLDATGAYEGLDIVPSGIAWCRENITPQYPNFRFTLADVFNDEYNPQGRFKASEYRFPYGDSSFDLVVLVSVFTHMLPDDMNHYIKEIRRVLRPGGRCYATYFLINEDVTRLMQSGRSIIRFKHHVEPHWLINVKAPALSVGYDEAYVRDTYARSFANTVIHFGGWSTGNLNAQDVVVATTAS
jgi:SAM-dependent methyltransferase